MRIMRWVTREKSISGDTITKMFLIFKIDIPASCISLRYQSIPVPDRVLFFRYRKESSYSGTWPFPTSYLQTVRHSGINKNVYPSPGRSYFLWRNGAPVPSARPHCWWWKKYTLHVHTAGGGKRDTPCASILLAVERNTLSTSILLAWKGIHSARPYY